MNKPKHKHHFTIPVEWEYQRRQQRHDPAIVVWGNKMHQTIDDEYGEWLIIAKTQATRKIVVRLMCECGATKVLEREGE